MPEVIKAGCQTYTVACKKCGSALRLFPRDIESETPEEGRWPQSAMMEEAFDLAEKLTGQKHKEPQTRYFFHCPCCGERQEFFPSMPLDPLMLECAEANEQARKRREVDASALLMITPIGG